MSLKDQILADVKSAMKAQEKDRLSALRFLQSQIKNKEIDVRPNTLSEEDVTAVVKKSVKQLKESIEQYEQGGRAELADKEKKELQFIEVYLPESMTEDQVSALVDQSIQELSASGMKDMGKVMKDVLEKAKGAADNKMVSQIVKSKLS